MPELPEIETARRALAPRLAGRRFIDACVRERRLRWPVPDGLAAHVTGQPLQSVTRRAKYLLLNIATGSVIVHLGMSGSLRLVAADTPAGRHDHVDFLFDDGAALRLNDPRRFGSVLWHNGDPEQHALLRKLGPEPFSAAFSADRLYARSRGRRVAVKPFLMDAANVVGVGNIYASEALFMSGIRPSRSAGRISLARYARLVDNVRYILTEAIAAGGTTLRDFVNTDGRPGYFFRHLRVYGRAGAPCERCGRALHSRVIGQRSTFFCSHCQT